MADKVPDEGSNEERINPLELFSPQMQIPVYGLAFIGHLQEDIPFCGHKFTIKTLRPAEKAAASIAAQPWRETLAEPDVWANAQVALALVAIDDDPNFCPPVGPNIDEFAKARLRFVTNPEDGFAQPTLGYLWAKYLELEKKALDGIRELQDLSERSREPSSPSPDSLTAPGTLTDETNSGTRP